MPSPSCSICFRHSAPSNTRYLLRVLKLSITLLKKAVVKLPFIYKVASGSAMAGRTNLQYANGAGETEGTVRLFGDGLVSLNRIENYIFCEGPMRSPASSSPRSWNSATFSATSTG
ncbi:uncharacterized protein LOC114578838 isoform X1 [Dendrobium catenatum]|uniref:uncharacterized protein LOC114578838 isoform X1 n=1 Tax=Dendrobium catenatum TaxID=906689 RepID=UPI00109EE395|nr:uncharacterized protein LOC114578838 isoform X1 [Dendrobium catenatum]